MKKLISALALGTAIGVPAAAIAKPVTLTATLNSYYGPGAYLAIYVTDKNGAYQGTLWLAGSRAKYFRHLSGWYRATRGDMRQARGKTSASVGAGRSLKVSYDLADALFDAGYVLHVDAAVENRRESPSDVVLPLTRANLGKVVGGRRFIKSFSLE